MVILGNDRKLYFEPFEFFRTLYANLNKNGD